MNPVSEDIKDYFEDSSRDIGELAAISGWSIHISTMPDESEVPDTAIGLFDYGGAGPDMADFVWEYPRLQVRIRGTAGGYLAAYAKAEEIKNALHGVTNTTINGTRYISMKATSDIGFLGYDERNRPLLSISFVMERTTT